MQPQEFANLGFGLAAELAYQARRIFCKDDDSWRLAEDADNLRAKAQDIL